MKSINDVTMKLKVEDKWYFNVTAIREFADLESTYNYIRNLMGYEGYENAPQRYIGSPHLNKKEALDWRNKLCDGETEITIEAEILYVGKFPNGNEFVDIALTNVSNVEKYQDRIIIRSIPIKDIDKIFFKQEE